MGLACHYVNWMHVIIKHLVGLMCVQVSQQLQLVNQQQRRQV
jgi:hypothetical protein